MNNTFGIVGGDKRQLYLAQSIKNDGYDVYICGFELSSDTTGLSELPVEKLLKISDNIILPLPTTRDGENIFAPYSSVDIPVDDEFIISLINKNVYGGLMNKLVMTSDLWSMVNWGDYYLREELAISNAVPTAEGAVALAVTEYEGMLCGSKCLITGFGRIGKILTRLLTGMGARVTVAARKAKDFAMIRGMGAEYVSYSQIHEGYDVIFNTVPEVVLTDKIISYQHNNTIIIELATLPGGVDRKSAATRGVRVDAQSLPGKFAPKAAGEFIKEAVYNMLEE